MIDKINIKELTIGMTEFEQTDILNDLFTKIHQNPNAILDIEDPSDGMILEALKKDYNLLYKIKNIPDKVIENFNYFMKYKKV